MRIMRILVLVSAVLLSTLVLVRCSDSGTDNGNQPNFEVREWGVLVGCVGDVSYFLTSRPEVSSLVRLPVIYVHSRDKSPFSVLATFKTGRPSDTYPPATLTGTTVEWQNVEFVTGTSQPKLSSASDFVPLENVIPVLNDVDADAIEYNGWLSRFLFYEGSMTFTNRVIAAYDRDSYTAGVTNRGGYTVYNVNLVVRRQNTYGPSPQCLFAHWDKVDPGQTVSGSLAEEPAYSYLADLKLQGFSQKEAESFASLWESTLNLSGSMSQIANLVYRLPQTEYDSLITLSVTPAPDKLVRTLYVLIHLQEAADSAIVRRLVGSWEWVQSFGGIAGRLITPATEGYTKTVHFFDDWSYREERNDTTFWETTYQVYQESAVDTIINVLRIGEGEPMDIFNLTDSTLELFDRCIDCYQHSFRRLSTR